MLTKDIRYLLYTYYQTHVINDQMLILIPFAVFDDLLNRCRVYYDQREGSITGLMLITVEPDKAYLTLLYGPDDVKRALLLDYRKEHPNQPLWVHFFDPNCMAWYPKKNVTHPCIQGVLEHSLQHDFLLSMGFEAHSYQQTYYKDLTQFKVTEEITNLKQNHAASSIDYIFYNPDIHSNLQSFASLLDAPHWADVILKNNTLINPLPLLVATRNHQLIGFAGPLKKEQSGRGYFAGIGVIKEEQGKQIGKVLFYMLCHSLKSLGADYMTLFTGIDNPAKKIYTHAGFEIVKTFVTMKWVSY